MATAPTAPQRPQDAAPLTEPDRQVVYLDPSVLVRDEHNARTTDTEPDERLVRSVKEIGVEEAISVRPLNDGTGRYGVFKGWRRSQAAQIANATAVEEGREPREVPAFVRADLVGRDGWTRFLSLTENDIREDMALRDTVHAVELSLVGMSEVERSRATRAMGLGRNASQAARKASQLKDSDLRKATAEGLDLEQLAAFYEVQEVTGALRKLTEAMERDTEEGKGKRGHWDHAMSQLRQEMADTKARETAVKALADVKIPLLKDHFGWGEKDLSRPLSQLTTALLNPITPEMHASCPGHSARLDENNEPVWYCSDPEKYRHRLTAEAKKPAGPGDEEKKAERRRTIARNKAWRAARETRKDFISQLCQAKTLPEEARKLALRTDDGHAVLLRSGSSSMRARTSLVSWESRTPRGRTPSRRRWSASARPGSGTRCSRTQPPRTSTRCARTRRGRGCSTRTSGGW